MKTTSIPLQIFAFHHRLLVWIVLFFLFWSYLPAISFAQQPTATISTINGIVLVNGQQQGQGTILNAGDVIETQTGASVVLSLSDGSALEVGEKTQVDLAELRQTATQARVSRIKLMWGWVRAKLSPGHQHAGSSFDIETPNAVIGVKFSQPDVEVSYDPAKQETIGLAHTVQLMAKNLLTNEEALVPVGSTVIIVGATIKIIAGILAITAASEAGTAGANTAVATTESAGTTSTGATTSASTSSTGTSSSGMGIGTKIAIGIGATAAVAGGVVIAVGLDNENSSSENDTEDECHIDTPLDVAEGGVIYTSAGNRCDIWLSYGRWSLEEVNTVLSEMFYEATVNDIPLQPLTPLGIHQAGEGYDIHQTFRTEVLQKGSYSVKTIYRRNQSVFHIKQFTIQAD